MGTAGHDDAVPTEGLAVVSEKIIPAGGGIFLGEQFHELEGSLLHAVGLRNAYGGTVICASCGFETNFAEILVVTGVAFAGELAEPAVGVMDLNGVEAVAVHTLEERRVIAHEPNDELALRLNAGIDRGTLQVGGFALLVENEVDLAVFLRAGVDFAGAGGDFVPLRTGVLEGERRIGGEKRGQVDQRRHQCDAEVGGAHEWTRVEVAVGEIVSESRRGDCEKWRRGDGKRIGANAYDGGSGNIAGSLFLIHDGERSWRIIELGQIEKRT